MKRQFSSPRNSQRGFKRETGHPKLEIVRQRDGHCRHSFPAPDRAQAFVCRRFNVNGDGIDDTGVFVWSAGKLRLVVRTGTVIPGVGTVAHLMNPYLLDPNKVTDNLYGGGKFIPNVYVIDQQGVIRWQRVGHATASAGGPPRIESRTHCVASQFARLCSW